MNQFARNLMVLMAKGGEPWSSHRFQSACQIPCNSVVGAKIISTSVFLDSAFQTCAMACDCLAVLGKCVLSVLHQYQSQVCPQVIGLALFSSNEFSGWPCSVPTSFRRWGECCWVSYHWVPLSCALYKSWEILYFQGLICLSSLSS